MSSLKRLQPYNSDLFEVNKSWSFSITGALENTLVNGFEILGATKSLSPSTDQSLLRYNLINQLFYHNRTDLVSTSSIMNTIYYESSSQQPNSSSYYSMNENPGFLNNFPTDEGDRILIMSINQDKYGDSIKPGTFAFSSSAYYIYDDKIGNLFDEQTAIGNIFYSHGLAIITNEASIVSILATLPYNLSYKNIHVITENNIVCNVKSNEFNLSYNPSLLNDLGDLNSGVEDYATGSIFTPYATSVGLFNDKDELLVIAKLAKPYPLSKNNDNTFIIRWDS
jgi:hypothetical protein